MSYHEQAQGINKDLVQLFNSLHIREFTKRQREDILNIMIRIGQVAKFRCRSNAAYDNFITECFRDLATVERVQLKPGEDFKVLTATLKPLTHYEDFLAKHNLEDTKESFKKFVKSINPKVEVSE